MALIAGIAVLFVAYIVFIGAPLKRARENRYEQYVEERGRAVSALAVECPQCEEEALMKVFQSGEEQVFCRHCGYEDSSE